jgi:hypothetical protein
LLSLFTSPDSMVEVPQLQNYYSLEAKELMALVEKYGQIFSKESTVLEKLNHPARVQTTTVPSLVLPAGITLKEQRVMRNFPSDLTAIQEVLRAQPIDEEGAVAMVEDILETWKRDYEGKPYPEAMETLVSHLKDLVVRLSGWGTPVTTSEEAPAAAEVRSLLEQLRAACEEITGGIDRLKSNRPRIEKRLADLAAMRTRYLENAVMHEEMAADAKRRAATVTDMEEADALRLKAHDDAVQLSSEAAGLLTKRRSDAETFLTRDNAPANQPPGADGLLPEVAIVLSYKLPGEGQ